VTGTCSNPQMGTLLGGVEPPNRGPDPQTWAPPGATRGVSGGPLGGARCCRSTWRSPGPVIPERAASPKWPPPNRGVGPPNLGTLGGYLGAPPPTRGVSGGPLGGARLCRSTWRSPGPVIPERAASPKWPPPNRGVGPPNLGTLGGCPPLP
jgi:hypothetical protein